MNELTLEFRRPQADDGNDNERCQTMSRTWREELVRVFVRTNNDGATLLLRIVTKHEMTEEITGNLRWRE